VGFFQTFWTWLHSQLATYIGNNTAHVASVLAPAILASGTLYVMIWGYLHLTGRIEEPFIGGLKRIITLAVVLGITLHLWLYNSLIVNTFYEAPTQFAAAIVGVPDPVATIDAIWSQGGQVAESLLSKFALSIVGVGFLIVAVMVWLLMGLLCVRVHHVPVRALEHRPGRAVGHRAPVHRDAAVR
jgi:type IV secretion system protein VirB6